MPARMSCGPMPNPAISSNDHSGSNVTFVCREQRLPCIIMLKAKRPTLCLHQDSIVLTVSHVALWTMMQCTYSLQAPSLIWSVGREFSLVVFHSLTEACPWRAPPGRQHRQCHLRLFFL